MVSMQKALGSILSTKIHRREKRGGDDKKNDQDIELCMVTEACNPSTGRLMQEDCCELKASLKFRARPCLKNKTN